MYTYTYILSNPLNIGPLSSYSESYLNLESVALHKLSVLPSN